MSQKHLRENDTVVVETTSEKSEVALREESIQAFWAEHDIFNKSLQKPAGAEPKGDFVFYDGPPFATGTPHYGHILAGTIKDAIPRFWTMQGYRVRRKWGWDCHGLPLENLIEKKLGLSNKREIEEYGIKNFNEQAREAVLEYRDDWKKVVPRMGRWADMENDYKTMDSTYTESVWWVFSQLHKKGLVYEGFKSMHLCPRCGTTLSNFEVNLGYKDIKDIAVTVKLPLLDEAGIKTDSSLLVWTTTPWTLPGNLAAAVNRDFTYVKVKVTIEGKEEHLILAKGRLAQLGDLDYEIIDEIPGHDLVGQSYEPPFPFLPKEDFDGKDKAWKIYHADYVELGEEGTGAVHLAPAYGEEDMVLAKEHGIPIKHHVDYEGRFMPFVADFASKLVKPKDDEKSDISHLDTDVEIVKALKESGKLFKKENITHSYPHCWRDDTPLLNYATTSWFVKVTDLKDDLVEINNQVNWVPEHVGSNRFGRWLEGARDWAISRQRYWGAPLPIWRNPKSGEYKVFGSLAELQEYVPKSGNKYFLMRHGEAVSNLNSSISVLKGAPDQLTELGIKQVEESVTQLKDKKIDLILHSGFLRTKDTALSLAKSLGLMAEQVIEDERLVELNTGVDLNGKPWSEYYALFASEQAAFTTELEGRENRQDVVRRVGRLLYELEKNYKDKNIVIVGHASSLFGLRVVAGGLDVEEAIDLKKSEGFMANAEILELPFASLPHNDNYELDYHRPYIDDIELFDTDGTKLVRVPEVFDCWFESGAMPYGQHHYPFKKTEEFNPEQGIGFPADFIAEALDQTRGWFYSLLVIGTGLFGISPYKNVIVTGLVLAEDGKKMSKSLRNYPDPMELADRVGTDAMRYYLLSSPIMRAEDLNFSEKEVLDLQRKNIGRLHNVLAMYEMFADGTKASADSTHLLDRWIIARLNQLIKDSTTGYKNYELDKATRPLADFIDDLSVWYLRRSRDRFKEETNFVASTSLRVPVETSAVAVSTSTVSTSPRLVAGTQNLLPLSGKVEALGTLRFVLREVAKVMAPAMPFYAEYLYLAVREETEAQSVHLARWPEGGLVDETLLDQMAKARAIVNEALMLRTQAGIKVRQPLASLKIADDNKEKIGWDEYLSVIADEVNVKSVTMVPSSEIPGSLALDTVVTPELKQEGEARDFMRGVQERRKAEGFAPQDRIDLLVQTDIQAEETLTKFADIIKKTIGANNIIYDANSGDEFVAGSYTYRVTLKKI